MKSSKITVDEWVEAIESALRGSENSDGITSRELSERTGMSAGKTREILRKLIGLGLVKSVRVMRYDICNRLSSVPAYVLVKKPRR